MKAMRTVLIQGRSYGLYEGRVQLIVLCGEHLDPEYIETLRVTPSDQFELSSVGDTVTLRSSE
jgi:hypothetical protein